MNCCPPVNTDPRRFNGYVKPTPSRSEPLSHAEYLRRKAANNNLPLSKPQALVQTGTGPYVKTDWMISKIYRPTPSGLSSLFYAVSTFPTVNGLSQVDNRFFYSSSIGRYVASASSYNGDYGVWNAFTRASPPSSGLLSTAWISATNTYDSTGTYTGSTSTTIGHLGLINGESITIECPSYFILKSYKVISSNKTGVSTPMTSWVLAGSNDGITYVPLDSQTGQTLLPNKSATYSTQYNNLNYSKYILIVQSVQTGSSSQGANLVSLNLYSNTDPLDPGITCCTREPSVPAVHPGGTAIEAGFQTDSKAAAAGRGTLSRYDTVNETEWNTTLRRKGLVIHADTFVEASAGAGGGRRTEGDLTLKGTLIYPPGGLHSVGSKGL